VLTEIGYSASKSAASSSAVWIREKVLRNESLEPADGTASGTTSALCGSRKTDTGRSAVCVSCGHW